MKLSALIFLVALASPVLADTTAKTEAKRHIDHASQLHKDGKFQQALDELTVAYSLDPQPELLYAIGQMHVKLGQCTLATAFYERFLTTRPADGPASAAQEAIASCKLRGDTPAAPEPPVTPPALPPQPPPPSPLVVDQEPVDSAWYRDKIGDALVGGGVVVAVLGGIVYASAVGKLDDADQATSYAAQQALVDKAHSDRLYSVVLVAGGAALIGAGIYHYILDGAAPRAQVGVVPSHGGAFASLSLRF